MAKVTFISLYDRNAYGLRLMSANLKQQGHHCDIIFLKQYTTFRTNKVKMDYEEYPWLGINKQGRIFKYASDSIISPYELELLRQTLDKLQPEVIGMTVNTPLRSQAIKVTQYIKKHFNIPVIWGGYDPTVNFTDCIDHCDYVCVGEGDQTILDVASHIDQGHNLNGISNLAFRQNGTTVVNPLHPLETNINNYPWRDNSPEDKYFIEDKKLIENCVFINDKPIGVYQALSSRGCPYNCSYCCEATFKSLYSGEKFLRRRTPQDIIAELAEAKRCFDLTRIHFEDEIFTMNYEWLKVFVPLYKEKINLPFTAYIYPVRNIEHILRLLNKVGLNNCCLALESGSERINKTVFNRVYNHEYFIKTALLCKELGIKFYTDVITYNPYEEEEDLRKTLDVLIEIGGGFDIYVNKLFVLPGTKLSKLMMQNGISINDVKNRDAFFNYYCRLFWITSITRHSKRLISIIEKMKIFRQYPRLLNPALIEFPLNPLKSMKSLAQRLLPKKIKTLLGSLRYYLA